MADEKPKAEPEQRVHCRRVDCPQTPDEHESCPYCFGRKAQVKEGDHALFCDFEPGVDPIAFGFPPDIGRMAKG